MGKVTKAAGNRYCIARLAAATCNDCFGSREGAAYVTGIDRTRLARIEIGTVTPLPEEVRVLADAYNTPELLNYYCSHDCQIGRCMDILLPEEAPSCIEQIAVQAAVALRNAEHIRVIVKIADAVKLCVRVCFSRFAHYEFELSRFAYSLRHKLCKPDV